MSIFQPATPGLENLPLVEGQEVEESAEEMEVEQEPTEDVDNSFEEEQTEDEELPSEEETSEELLAGKFKTPQDLVNAYQNLQREYSRKSSELSQYKRQEPQQSFQQPQQQEQNFDWFWEDLRSNPIQTLMNIATYAAEQKVNPLYETQQNAQLERNIDTLSKEYKEIHSDDGLNTLFSKVNEIAQEMGNPALAKNPTQRILKLAAQEAFGDKKQDLYKKAVAKGKQEAMNTLRTKQGLAAPTGTKPKAQEKSIEEQMADAIVNAGRRGGIFGR